MRYLLDTHVWLWMNTARNRLGAARDLIEDEASELVLSAASTWEIAIKVARGRLSLPLPVEQYVEARIGSTAVAPLSIAVAHTVRVAELPLHHRDPFDRILIAQAQVERLPIMTADRAFDAYDCEVIRVG